LVLDLANLGRAVRNKAKIKVRQPLKEIFVSGTEINISKEITTLVLDELNVKAVKDGTGMSFSKLTAKPNLKTLGKRLGAKLNPMSQKIAELSHEELLPSENGQTINVALSENESFDLAPEDLLLKRIDDPEFVTVTENNISVSICTTIDEVLRIEGIARELVNRIQNTRKDAGFEVMDRIKLNIEAPEEIVTSAASMKDYILSETLSVDLLFTIPESFEFKEEWKIDDINLNIYVSRVL